MAGEIPPLNIQVNVDTSGVTKGVQETSDKLKGVTSTVEGATSKFGGLKTVMLGTFAAGAIQKGIQEMTGFLKESVKAAEEAQTSTTALATAMNNAKINTEANRAAVERTTEAMGNLGFSGNSTREALTKMVTATGSLTQSQKLMGVAADYARLKHMDLSTAATVLTRGTTGAAKAFREYGITLDTTIPKNEAITKAFNELNQKIGGQAAAYAETYAGKMAILGAKSEELKEKVGTLLLPILTKLSTWFINSMEWITKHKSAMEAIAAVVATVVSVAVVNLTRQLWAQVTAWLALNWPIMAIVAAIALIATGFVWAWNKFSGFRHAVVTGIEGMLDIIAFLVRAVGTIAEAYLQVVTGPMRLMLKGLGFFVPAAKTAAEELNKMPKAVGDFFDGAAKKIEGFKSKVESVKDTKIDIKLPNLSDMLAKAGGKAGGDPNIEASGSLAAAAAAKATAAAEKAAAKAAKIEEARVAKLQVQYDKMKGLEADYIKTVQDRQDKMDAAAATRDQAREDATTKYEQTVVDIRQAYQDKVDAATTTHDQAVEAIEQNHIDAMAAIQQKAADNAIQLEQKAAEKRAGIIQQSIDAMTSAWANVTKLDLGSIFKSDSSAGGLVKGMKDQLAAILKLQKDAGDLAAQGYSESFINQVISQGPEVGDQMAQAVLNATPETASEIKNLYAQINTVSDTGLTALATKMSDGTHFATSAMAAEYAQVGVDLRKSLADNQAQLTTDLATEQGKYSDALTKAQQAFDKAIKSATDTRDLALKKAQDTLTNALTAAQEAYDKSIASIAKSMDDKLSALQDKIAATAAAIAALGGTYIPNPDLSLPGLATTLNPLGGPKDTSNYGPSITQINNINGKTAPSDILNATIAGIKYGTPIAANTGASSLASGTSVRGN